MLASLRTVVPVWALALVGAVVVIIAVPGADHLQALQTVMVGAVFATFGIQLAIVQKVGFVDRVMASLVGAAVILAIATAVVAVVAAA
jgi:purine-cytosine permease-like protein